jgi:glutathione reductase (NADPH)
MKFDYDLLVLGAGSGGIAAARRAAEYGAKVGVIESDRLGGTCVNRGCVPKKLMVYASHFSDVYKDAKGYGWSAVHSSFDWPTMITAVNNEVSRLNGIYQSMLDRSGVEVITGQGTFLDAHTLEVQSDGSSCKVTADKVLIAVGGKPVKPEIPGIEHTITSDEIFHLPEQPKHAVILGGGYIGSEFACILNGLGSKVTQIIRGEKILRGFDQDLRTEIQQAMINHGIGIITDARGLEIAKTESGVTLTLHTEQRQTQTVIADVISLAAIGRRPNTEYLGLEHTGVELHGHTIVVNQYSQTAVDNIYAVGDCTNKINLTPVAINEGRAFADTVFGGKSRTISYENIPTAIFTTPEAATVGLTETEARAHYGDAIKVYRARFRPMYYTLAGRDEKTLMKLIVDQTTDKVLGAHMVGDSAAEIIQGVAIAIKMGATKADFDATVAIHPSSAEEFVTMR